MKQAFIFILCLAGCAVLQAQTPAFQREYTTTLGLLQSHGVDEGPGGYFVTGFAILPNTEWRTFVLHTDFNGDTLWAYSFDTSPDESAGYGICANADSGCTVTGRIAIGGMVTWNIFRLDKNGTLLWSYLYDNAGYGSGYRIRQTADGGFISVGDIMESPDYYTGVIRIDAAGQVIWSKQIERRIGVAMELDVILTSDGGYSVLSGFGNQSTLFDVHHIHLDSNGNVLWQYTYGGPNTDFNGAFTQLSTGQYAIAFRYSNTATQMFGPALLITDSMGVYQSAHVYITGNDDKVKEVYQSSTGDFVIAGMFYPSPPQMPNDGSGSAFICNSSGTLLNARTYGDADFEEIYDACPLSSGGHLLCGNVASGNPNTVFLVKTNLQFSSTCNESDSIYPTLIPFIHAQVCTAGDSILTLSVTAVPLVQISLPFSIVDICNPTTIAENSPTEQLSIFPNPSQGIFTIQTNHADKNSLLEIRDGFGRIVVSTPFTGIEQQVDLSSCAPGIYFLSITNEDSTTSRRIFIE